MEENALREPFEIDTPPIFLRPIFLANDRITRGHVKEKSNRTIDGRSFFYELCIYQIPNCWILTHTNACQI